MYVVLYGSSGYRWSMVADGQSLEDPCSEAPRILFKAAVLPTKNHKEILLT